MNRPATGAVLMIAAGAALFALALARHENLLTLVGLACMAIGFGRLHNAGR
jgi:hypothetical protein